MMEEEIEILAPEPLVPKRVRGRDLLLGVSMIWLAELVLGGLLILWIGPPESLADHPIPLMVISLASGSFTAAIAWLFVCWKYDQPVLAGFLLERISKENVEVAVLIGLVLALVAPMLANQSSTGDHLFERMLGVPGGLAALGIMMLILPFVEEIYYRGFIYPVIAQRWGAFSAVMVVTAWFMAAHAPQAIEDPISIPVVGAIGAVFTLQRWKTGSLTAPLVTHLVYNFTLLMGLLFSTLLALIS